MHTSAHTHTFTRCTHTRKQSSENSRGTASTTHSAQQQNTHTCTQDRDAPALSCLPGRARTLEHLCKYTGMHVHTHLCAITPMCKCKPGHLRLPSAPPAPCPLHANPPGAELCHGNPQPRSQGPQSRATGHAEPGVWGTAPPSTDSNTPLCLIPCQPGTALGASTGSDM